MKQALSPNGQEFVQTNLSRKWGVVVNTPWGLWGGPIVWPVAAVIAVALVILGLSL